MKFTAVVSALTALSLSVSGVAFAQSDKDARADESARASRAGLDPATRMPDRAAPRAPQARPDPGRYHGPDRAPDRRVDARPGRGPDRDFRHDGRGAGPEHNFYRGGRLPMDYRNRQYVVDDWRGHHLSAPPRGYNWVQVGGDYVLVAIATGIIASILLNQ